MAVSAVSAVPAVPAVGAALEPAAREPALAQDADARMTAERRERKYVLTAPAARALEREVAARLPVHRYRGAGASVLPGARAHVTTIYFDTEGHAFYRSKRLGGTARKLRARQYYEEHPDLVELATSPAQLVRHTPLLWLELKQRVGERTEKHRIGVPRGEVARFLETGQVSDGLRAMDASVYDARAALSELQRVRREVGAPLRASCVVNYRRSAYQDAGGQLRITLDRQLRAYAPPAALWELPAPIVRESLGAAVHCEPGVILELKSQSALPAWLRDALADAGAEQSDYSKFERATEALLPAQ